MSKKPDKTAAAESDIPKKRSKLRLALLALVPMVLAGGGAAGWTYYAGAATHDAEAAEAEAAGQDHIEVSAVPSEIAAETSFTHSYGLAMMIAPTCGRVPLQALKEASDAEARADGLLVNLSWAAAARRTVTLDERACRYFQAEIRNADAKAANIAAARAAAENGGGHAAKSASGHGQAKAAAGHH